MTRNFHQLDDQQIRHLIGDYIIELHDDSRLLEVFNADAPSGTNAWFDACDGRGQTAGYIANRSRVWQHFDEVAITGRTSRRTVAIAQQVRCALISAAINAMGTQIPPHPLCFWSNKDAGPGPKRSLTHSGIIKWTTSAS